MTECWFTGADGLPHGSAPYATQTFVNGKWSAPTVWCPGDVIPAVAVGEVRDQVVRLLPRVTVGHAFRDAALVNTEEIFWADTPTARALPDVAIVGQQVALRISIDHVKWDFGDGSTDSTSDPGRAYDPNDPCDTVECSDYYGHTYRQAGDMTVTTTISWHAQYRINGGDWTDIAQPVTGPATTQQLRVVEARGVLVPNAR